MKKTTIEATAQRETVKRPRRRSGNRKTDRLENGAFLVEFKQPEEPVDGFRCVPSVGMTPQQLLAGEEWQSVVNKYRTMERKGFRVTRDIGCLIPDPQYSTHQHFSMKNGHHRTFAFFARWIPKQTGICNVSGCPSSVQISHLCHRRNCVRIDHLIAEEQWRSCKRVYCGSNGRCDCGNEIQCLRRHDMEDPSEDPVFCETRSEAREALNGAPQFVIHGPNRFTNMDRKARQRKLNKKRRKRKQQRHAYVTKRKQTRLALRVNRDV